MPTEEENAAVLLQSAARGRTARKEVRSIKNWRTVRVVVKTGQLLKGIRIKRVSELSLAFDKSRATLSVESEEALKNLKLWEQGDEALYTRENLEARYRNRSDPDIFRALTEWWEFAMLLSGGDPEAPSMTKAAYISIFVRVCQQLLDDDEEWDEEEATRMTEESWAEDSRGKSMMNRSMFNDGLFERARRRRTMQALPRRIHRSPPLPKALYPCMSRAQYYCPRASLSPCACARSALSAARPAQ